MSLVCTEVVDRDAVVCLDLLQSDVLDAPEDRSLGITAWWTTAQRQR